MSETYDMKIEEPHFRDILNGDKTVEGRANGPGKDYDQIREGDAIQFIPVDSSYQEFSVEELPEDLPADATYEVAHAEGYERGELGLDKAEEASEPLTTYLQQEGVENVLPRVAEEADSPEEALDDAVELYNSISNYDERIPEHGIFAFELGERLA